jgi:hypothetical protein
MSQAMSDEAEVLARLSELNALWIELARSGDFAAAWKVSDEAGALRAGLDCSCWPRHHQFLWRGEPLDNKRVLVRCYHGLGDTIQFIRFLPHLRSLAREVILWAQPALIPLISRQKAGAHRVLPLHDGAPRVKCDVNIELAELMHALRVDERLIQVRSPYLRVPSSVARVSPRQRIGVVWRAGEWSPHRSIPCSMLECLQEVPDVDWIVLQRGPALSEWSHSFGCVPEIRGILDEAIEMRALDLLISVDTCSAHLAGALGVPVWTLLPFDADWRWMTGRTDTPWYPTMRLFRQQRAGEWGGVLENVLEELQRGFVSMSERLSR